MSALDIYPYSFFYGTGQSSSKNHLFAFGSLLSIIVCNNISSESLVGYVVKSDANVVDIFLLCVQCLLLFIILT